MMEIILSCSPVSCLSCIKVAFLLNASGKLTPCECIFVVVVVVAITQVTSVALSASVALSIPCADTGPHVPAHPPPDGPHGYTTHASLRRDPHCTCGDASPGAPGAPGARSLSAGLTESAMPLSSSAAGSSLSESDPHVESHSSTVLGSLKRQLPNRFPI